MRTGLRPSLRRAPAEAAQLSIVVLPFTNLSDDPAQDYFADGITENLTTELSRLHNSFVIARNTAFTFKGKNLDAKAIGKELGVRYVLEGSVQRDANRVRVNAQLIDAESGAHLWADRFEEDVVDLFKLQDEVVARLARTLQIELVNAEAQRSLHDRPRNPDAIDLTMRGLALLNQTFTKANHYEALDLFEQALTLDPANADALAGAAIVDAAGLCQRLVRPKCGPICAGDAAGQPSSCAQSGPSQRASHQSAPDHVQSETGRRGVGKPRLFPRLRHRFAPIPVWPMPTCRWRPGKTCSDIMSSRYRISNKPSGSVRGTHISVFGTWTWAESSWRCAGTMRRSRKVSRPSNSGYRTVLSYTALAAFYAAADKMPEAKAALAEAMNLNPKLSVAWFHAHNSAWVDAGPGFRENLIKAGLPEE